MKTGQVVVRDLAALPQAVAALQAIAPQWVLVLSDFLFATPAFSRRYVRRFRVPCCSVARRPEKSAAMVSMTIPAW